MRHYGKGEARDWARERFCGLENILTPSLTIQSVGGRTMMALDEDGIRHDVRECKRHKFFMTTAGIEGLPMAFLEFVMRPYLEIAVDEAKGDLLIDAYISANSFEDTLAAARLAQDVGCHSILLAYPPYFRPRSEEEIYGFTKAVCDAIDIGVIAYPSHKYDFERFHPSTFSPALLERIANIENVVAMKLGVSDVTFATECFERFGDRVLLAEPSPNHWSTYVTKFGQRWAGSAPYEFLQDHEHTHATDYFSLLIDGRLQQARDLYWRVFPRAKILRELLEYPVYQGSYNMMQFKYISWLAGFNGGPLTLPTPRLYEHQRQALKAARRAMGLTVPDDDDGFYVGRAQAGRPPAA